MAAFPSATIIRPSVMFGKGDLFVSTLEQITRYAPVIPLFDDGTTLLQPACVEDVADAIVRAPANPETIGKTLQFGGPKSLTYRAIIELILASKRRRRILMPLPFWTWEMLARIGSILPSPPITPVQIALMRTNNIVGTSCLTSADLGIEPRSIEEIVPTYV